MTSTDLQPIDISADYDFLLPLDHGQRIVAFKHFNTSTLYTKFSRFDWSAGRTHRNRLSDKLDWRVAQENVTQCGLN